mmetsp:Transcript_3380/g.11877  ORF Transcript_3380/g.11877 Transcript_3380/m.11877 type:complete len:339 (+) Transcript_3380:463-1479(+)
MASSWATCIEMATIATSSATAVMTRSAAAMTRSWVRSPASNSLRAASPSAPEIAASARATTRTVSSARSKARPSVTAASAASTSSFSESWGANAARSSVSTASRTQSGRGVECAPSKCAARCAVCSRAASASVCTAGGRNASRRAAKRSAGGAASVGPALLLRRSDASALDADRCGSRRSIEPTSAPWVRWKTAGRASSRSARTADGCSVDGPRRTRSSTIAETETKTESKTTARTLPKSPFSWFSASQWSAAAVAPMARPQSTKRGWAPPRAAMSRSRNATTSATSNDSCAPSDTVSPSDQPLPAKSKATSSHPDETATLKAPALMASIREEALACR